MGCRSSKLVQLEVPSARGRKHSRGTAPIAVRGGSVINSRENSVDRTSSSTPTGSESEESVGISSEQLSRSSVMTAAHTAIEDVIDDKKYVGLNSEDLKDVPIRTLLHLMKKSSNGGAYDFSDLPLRAILGMLAGGPLSTGIPSAEVHNASTQSIQPSIEEKTILREYTCGTVSQLVIPQTTSEEVSCQTDTSLSDSACASPLKKPPLPSPNSADKRPSLGPILTASSPLQLPVAAITEQHMTPKRKTTRSSSPALRSHTPTPQKTKPTRTSKKRKPPTIQVQPCLQMNVKVLQKRDKNTYRGNKTLEKRQVTRAL